MSAHAKLREAVNVDELKKRDALVRRVARLRADAVLERDTVEHWNRTHAPGYHLDASFWVKVIAWCDGEGPEPTPADADAFGGGR